MNLKKYRPDIDGLRFLAVFPVILFHLDISLFKGGFLGVDVFFVISGYLITNIIINQLDQKKFSVSKFYLRRARRLLPVLFLVLVLTLILSYIYYFPEEIQYLSKTILSVIFFVSNIFFWKTTNYFNDLTQQSPLLHTWSLSVEEQFYIFYPILLIFFINFFQKKKIIYIFIIFFICSVLLSSYAVHFHPNANFFLTPFRTFELLIGCITALILNVSKKNYLPNVSITNILCFCSITILVLSFIFFTKFSLLPSYLSLLPAFSTAMLIYLLPYSNKKIYYLFSNKVFVGFGKISYSLYLFHIPLIVFFPINNNIFNITFFLICLTIISYLSYKFIETPFRDKKKIDDKKFVKLLSLFSIVILSFSVISLKLSKEKKFENVLIKTLNEDKKEIYKAIKKVREEYDMKTADYFSQECNISTNFEIKENFIKKFEECKKKFPEFIVVLGDSHARDVYLSLIKTLKPKFVIAFLPSGCRPYKEMQKCKNAYERYKNFIIKEKKNISLIIYSQSGSKFLKHQYTLPINNSKIENTIKYLNKINTNENLVWLGPNIEPSINMNFSGLNTIYKEKYKINEVKHLKKVDKLIKEKLLDKKIKYLSKIELMNYKAEKDFYKDKKLTFRDTDHWSIFGQIYFGKKIFFSKEFEKIINK